MTDHVPEESKQEPIERDTSTKAVLVQNPILLETAQVEALQELTQQETAKEQEVKKRNKSIRRRKNRED